MILMTEALERAIGDIEGIWNNRGILICERSSISDIVEPPLVRACEILYDFNIRTLDSSANQNDVEKGHGWIRMDYDSMSETNQRVANKHFSGRYGDCDGGGSTSIRIPLTATSTCEEISNLAAEHANRFTQQAMRWTHVYSFEQVCQQFGYNPEDCTPKTFSEFYHLDEDTGLFFLSKGHYTKLKATPAVFDEKVQEAQKQ